MKYRLAGMTAWGLPIMDLDVPMPPVKPPRHRGGIVRGPQWRMLEPHDGFRIPAELAARLEREAERHARAIVDAIVGAPESG